MASSKRVGRLLGFRNLLLCLAFGDITEHHAFAGRRAGNVQYYLDLMCQNLSDGVIIHSASMDIMSISEMFPPRLLKTTGSTASRSVGLFRWASG